MEELVRVSLRVTGKIMLGWIGSRQLRFCWIQLGQIGLGCLDWVMMG